MAGWGEAGQLVLGHREAPHSEMLMRGWPSVSGTAGQAKSFCGLGINDNVASFVSQAVEVRGTEMWVSLQTNIL